VRQLLGYERLADPEMVKEINTLYRELWEPLHNYFCASAKLVSKDRHGAKVKRRHDRPMTPCDRLLQNDALSAWKKAQLRAARKALNPFELNRKLEAALRPLLLRALHSSRPTGSLHCVPAAATLNA
jgi:hypothetical protein